MGPEYLLDTNTVIDFSAKRLSDKAHQRIAQIIDDFPQISIINKIELLGFSNVPTEIISFAENAFIIALDDNIATETINLRKKYKIKPPDAIIAATAIVSNLTLVTSNVDDFKNIHGLAILNPLSII